MTKKDEGIFNLEMSLKKTEPVDVPKIKAPVMAPATVHRLGVNVSGETYKAVQIYCAQNGLNRQQFLELAIAQMIK